MKHEVKIRRSFNISGHTYRLHDGREAEKLMDAAHSWGTTKEDERIFRISRTQNQQGISNTFLHEILHMTSDVSKVDISEKDVRLLANGLHQVMEQHGVRFVF